jgi:hypothetical protein
MSTVDTDLYYAERLTNSRNGNPRFKFATADGPYVLSSDASCGYEVTNYTNRIPSGGSMRVRLHLTRAGRVWNLEELHA